MFLRIVLALFAHNGDVNLAAVNAVELTEINVLGVAADHVSVHNGEHSVVAAEHGFQMARRVAADGAVGGEEVVVVVRVKGGDQLFQLLLDVHLQAGQTFVDQDAGGGVGGDGENNAVLNTGFLNRFEDILGNADQLKFFFADQFDGSGFDHGYLTSIPSHLSALPPMAVPWPLIHFVAESTTMSAPQSKGLQR